MIQETKSSIHEFVLARPLPSKETLGSARYARHRPRPVPFTSMIGTWLGSSLSPELLPRVRSKRRAKVTCPTFSTQLAWRCTDACSGANVVRFLEIVIPEPNGALRFGNLGRIGGIGILFNDPAVQ